MSHTSSRTAREVFESHLHLRKEGATDEDIIRDYADDVVVLSGTGVHRGIDGIRETARILETYMPGGTWEYHNTLVEGAVAFLEWSGVARDGHRVCDGADSFVIRDGRIAAQTIHYTVRDNRSAP